MKIKSIDYGLAISENIKTGDRTLFHQSVVVIDNEKNFKFTIQKKKEQEVEDVIEIIRNNNSLYDVLYNLNTIPVRDETGFPTPAWLVL